MNQMTRYKINPLDPTGLSPIEDKVISTSGGGGGGPSTSISVTGEPKLTGDVTLSAGPNVVLTQTGQDIEIESTASGIPVGGTEGQILAKASATDYDVTWIDNFASSTRHLVKAAEAITKGMAVYVSGATGTNMLVSKASNDSEEKSSKVLGLSQSTLATNGQGYVVTEGLIANIDTSAAGTEGDPVWLGTNGNLLYGASNKPVAPANLVYIGVVTRKSATVGEIFVNVANGYEIEELHDVLVTSLANNQILAYESSTGLWKNKSIPTVLGYTPEDVANKDITGTLGTSDTKYPSQKAVKTYVDTGLATKEPTLTKGNLTESTSSVLTISGGSSAVIGSGTSIQVKQASGTQAGYLSSTDWTTFNNKEPAVTKGNLTESTSSVLTISGGTGSVIGSGTSIQVKQASGTQAGYLSSTDWTTFNNKQAALGFTAENVANKSTSTSLGTSDTLYPTQNAVKTYVDANNSTLQIRNETPTGTINGTNVTFTLANTPYTNNLRLYKNGVRLKPGAGNDYTISGNTITMATAPATGTALLADYELTSGTFAQGVSQLITNETPSGSVNGTNVNFTTAKAFIGGTLEVYINGVKQQRTTHYTETTPASGTFAMSDAPLTGDVIEVRYQNTLTSTGSASDVGGIQASSTATANKLMPLDANARIVSSLFDIGSSAILGGSGSQQTTASATYVDFTNLGTVTVNVPSSGKMLVVGTVGAQSNVTGIFDCYCRVVIGSTNSMEFAVTPTAQYGGANIAVMDVLTGLTPGSNTMKVQIRVNSASFTGIWTPTRTKILAIPIGA
jgi:hypothetical protein